MIGIDHLRPGRLRWSGGDDATTDDEAEPDARQRVRARGDVGRRERDSFRAPAQHRPRRLAPHSPCSPRGARSRGIPRPPARKRDLRQRAEDRTGADAHLVQRRYAPPRNAAGEQDPFVETTMAGAYLGRCLHVSPSEKIVVAKRLRLADTETM